MNTVHFYCVLCGSPMNAGADLAGNVCECPRCSRMVPVPAPIDSKSMTWPPTWPQDIISVEIKFPCPECKNRLEADARWAGAPVHCPECKEIIRVPNLASLINPSMKAAKISKANAARPLNNLSTEEVDFLNGPAGVAEPPGKSTAHAIQG